MSDALTADAIRTALSETAELPCAQIDAIVKTLGEDQAQRLLDEALAIEAAGGMKTTDGTRRRTLGGVFLRLARSRCTSRDRSRIFYALPVRIQAEEAKLGKSATGASPGPSEGGRQ